MEVEISRLPREGVRLRSGEPASIIDIEGDDAVFDEPIDVDVFARLTGDTLLVKGTINARPRLRCSRCLEYYEPPLRRPDYMFTITVRDGDIIDLTESIREDIIIAFPLKPLCSEDCKGLCPECGGNLNKGPCGCSCAGPGLSEQE